MQYKMTSYSDNFEDVLIRRAFPDEARGFYIDVGAYEPVDHSVTKHFYDAGWRGINIEPNPAPFAKLNAGRDRDVNLNIGLSNREGRLTLYEAPSACWSVDPDFLTGYFGADRAALVERSIPVTTLAKVCERHVPEGEVIHFLTIDVEGHEREVIEGGDWSRWRPRLVMAEANGADTWGPTLVAAGYAFVLFDGVNRLYVRDEDRHLIPTLSVPVNVSDRFLIHGYIRRINELERRVVELERSPDPDLTPMALRVARRLGRASRRYPRVSSIAGKIVRRLTG